MFQSENEIDRQAASEALAISRSHRSSRGIDVVDRVYKTAGVGRATTTGFTEKSLVDNIAKFKAERESRKTARKARIAAAQSYVEPK